MRRTIACRSGGATCARQEGAPPRRPNRTSAAPRSPRVDSCPVRRGPSSRSRTWMVNGCGIIGNSGGGELEHPRQWLGAQWAGLSPWECPTASSRQGRPCEGAGAELGPSQDCRLTTLPHMAGSQTWRGSMDARANGEPSATSARNARASVYGRPRKRSWARISSAARPTESDCERPLLPRSKTRPCMAGQRRRPSFFCAR